MLLVGLTVAEPPVYTYVAAPAGVIVNDEPLQIEPELTETIGLMLTVTDEIAVPKHPVELAPVIVYDVLLVGVTTAEPLE